VSTAEALYGVKKLGECICFAAAVSAVCAITVLTCTAISLTNNDSIRKLWRIGSLKTKGSQSRQENRCRAIRNRCGKKTGRPGQGIIYDHDTMAHFSTYLFTNSVTAYHDGVFSHLDYLIDTAKKAENTEQRNEYQKLI